MTSAQVLASQQKYEEASASSSPVSGSSQASSPAPSSEQQRSPMTGTTDQIGTDIEKIKSMGVEHIIFGYVFSPIGKDKNRMIEITKQLARSAK